MACNEISYVTNVSIFGLPFLNSVFVCTIILLLVYQLTSNVLYWHNERVQISVYFGSLMR